MIELTEIREGVLLPVVAQPGGRRDEIRGVHDGCLKVSVTAAPEKGKATDQIMRVVAESLELKRSQVELHSGRTSRRKSLLIKGVTRDDLHRRLTRQLSLE